MRIFVVFTEIVLLIIVLRSPFVQSLFFDMQQTLSEWFVDLTDIPEQHALNELRDTLSTELAPLKPYQKEYLLEITRTKSNLKRFDRMYCQTQDINPNFKGKEREKLCSYIHQIKFL